MKKSTVFTSFAAIVLAANIFTAPVFGEEINPTYTEANTSQVVDQQADAEVNDTATTIEDETKETTATSTANASVLYGTWTGVDSQITFNEDGTTGTGMVYTYYEESGYFGVYNPNGGGGFYVIYVPAGESFGAGHDSDDLTKDRIYCGNGNNKEAAEVFYRGTTFSTVSTEEVKENDNTTETSTTNASEEVTPVVEKAEDKDNKEAKSESTEKKASNPVVKAVAATAEKLLPSTGEGRAIALVGLGAFILAIAAVVFGIKKRAGK